MEEAIKGIQSFRNKFLVKLLDRLGYIENYSSGLDRIFKEYKRNKRKPNVETTLNMFKVILPNLNYKFNDIQEELLIERQDVPQNVPQKVGVNENVPQNVPQKVGVNENVPQNVPQKSDEQIIIGLITDNPKITRKEIAKIVGKTIKTIQRIINENGKIKYKGSAKSGHWEIIE